MASDVLGPKVSAAEGESAQFGKESLYRTEKRSNIAKVCFWTLSLFAIVASVVMHGDPSSQGNGQNEGQFDAPINFLSNPSTNNPQGRINYSIGEDSNRANRVGQNRGPQIRQKFSGPELLRRPREARITPGSLVMANLVTGASNGPVKAELKDPLLVNGEIILEAGSMLLGSGQSTEHRLYILFRQIVFPDGSFMDTEAQAADASDKVAGLKGSKVGSEFLKLGASMGLNFVGGMTTALSDSDVRGGVEVRKPTLKNAFLNGASLAALERSRDLMTDVKSEQPIIEVPAGSAIWILFGGER